MLQYEHFGIGELAPGALPFLDIGLLLHMKTLENTFRTFVKKLAIFTQGTNEKCDFLLGFWFTMHFASPHQHIIVLNNFFRINHNWI